MDAGRCDSLRADDIGLDTQVILKHIKTEAMSRDADGKNTPWPPEADMIVDEQPDGVHSLWADDNGRDTEVIMKHIRTEAMSRKGANGRNTPSPPEANTILHEQAVPEVRLLRLEPIHTTPAFEPKGDGSAFGIFCDATIEFRCRPITASWSAPLTIMVSITF